MKVGKLGHELVPMWDVSAIGEGLICYVTVQALLLNVLSHWAMGGAGDYPFPELMVLPIRGDLK